MKPAPEKNDIPARVPYLTKRAGNVKPQLLRADAYATCWRSPLQLRVCKSGERPDCVSTSIQHDLVAGAHKISEHMHHMFGFSYW